MDYQVFSNEKLKEYTQRAKKEWGGTREYQDYESRMQGRDLEEQRDLQGRFMSLFGELGALKSLSPENEQVQRQVAAIRDFICQHFYDCSLEVFASLGKAYGAGGEFTENIDKAGGEGTGSFAQRAIEIYVRAGEDGR